MAAPTTPLPPHTPGAGWARRHEIWGDRTPNEIPDDVAREVDDMIEADRRRRLDPADSDR
jgi:hypothetical protein